MDKSADLQSRLQQAIADKQSLCISAGHSKDFLGRQPQGHEFSLAGHTGIVDYDFRELVVTVRAATPLGELQQELAAKGQYLPFEPPAFNDSATIGGTLACGLSGPGRPFRGSARDYVLGTEILNGKAQKLTLGGQVMKNVAGYDLSRMMVGAMGTLGVILQCSLKVLPMPKTEKSLILEMTADQAISMMNRLAGQQHPLSAACYLGGQLYLRLSGFESSVDKSIDLIGGEALADGGLFWQQLNQQQLSFFQSSKPLWRLSLPSTAAAVNLPGETLIDWGGAQRWLLADEHVSARQVFAEAARLGGHATAWRGQQRDGQIYQPLSSAMLKLQQRLKQSLDPLGILNPGRLYADF